MSNQIEEEQKSKLLQDNNQLTEDVQREMDFGSNNDDLGGDNLEIRPSSSRVKKVLIWNSKRQEFDMSEEDKKELRDAHIKDPQLWRQFEELYKSLEPQNHPMVKKRSCIKATLLYTLASIFLLGVFYCFFIILQLALFNLIMLVVMAVSWYKLLGIGRAVISRVLDNGRKASFKSWIKQIKDLEWLKAKSIEIQENDEGRWIEIHLNETADERDDGIPEEENEDE